MSDQIYDFETQFPDIVNKIIDIVSVKRTTLQDIIYDLRNSIKQHEDIVTIAPIIKDFFDVAVKNDEQLVKVAALMQRQITSQKSGNNFDELLSESEKEELLKTANQDEKAQIAEFHKQVEEVLKEETK
jgi:ferritin-like protein